MNIKGLMLYKRIKIG